MQVPSFVAEAFGWLMFMCASMQPLLPTYFHLIASATLPIYAGAHASLSRPASAAPSTRRKRGSLKDYGDDDNDSSVIDMAGLTTQDAIAMPIIAGAVLTGLYFLIKWLQNPQLINMLINAYLSLYGLFAITTLLRDTFDLLHTLILPRYYAEGDRVYKFSLQRRCAEVISEPHEQIRVSPLPGPLARISLPKALSNLTWFLRDVSQRNLVMIRASWFSETGQLKLTLHGILGFTLASLTLVYYNFVAKPWWLTNLFGFAFCYGSLQLISPTTFSIGTLALSALFLYDIYMVFFTPMMVTVALAIDAPIKMVFPKSTVKDDASRAFAMLGLGDIVIPGIMIGHALRFDLFLFYLAKQKPPRPNDASPIAGLPSGTSTTEQVPEPEPPIASKATDATIQKAPYISVARAWGNRLWTTRIFGKSHPLAQEMPGNFPKRYFSAGIAGYLTGMIATLVGMHASNHAQPALLYLVPAVLIALWGTAWWKGELTLFYEFSDAISDENESPAQDMKMTRKDADEKAFTPPAKHDPIPKTDGRRSSKEKATQTASELSARTGSETSVLTLSVSLGALPSFSRSVEAAADSEGFQTGLSGSVESQDMATTAAEGHIDKKPRTS